MNKPTLFKTIAAVGVTCALAFTTAGSSLGLTTSGANHVAPAARAGVSPIAASTPTARLKWKIDFTGRAGTLPPSSVFNYDLGGGGWGNNEHQAYTTYNATYNGGGALMIRAKRVTYGDGDIPEPCPITGNVCEFESARLQTRGKIAFQYGRIEARMKMPAGDGTWPAFWLLGNDILSNAWPNCGEIDIMEAKGAIPNNVYGTAHGPGYSGGDGIVNTYYNTAPLSAGYHTYRVDWLRNSIKWYVDGKLYHTVTPSIVGSNHTYVFNRPMFLIMNLAMGGWFTGDIDPDVQKADFYIDYVSFSTLNGVGTITGTSRALAAGKP